MLWSALHAVKRSTFNLAKDADMIKTGDHDPTAAYAAVAARHLSPADQETLAANGFAGMAAPDVAWDRLHEEARRLMQTSDPGSAEAMDLARRWMGRVFEATGGDPSLTRKLRDVAHEIDETGALGAEPGSSRAMMDFVARAYGAAIAAGLTPRPEAAG